MIRILKALCMAMFLPFYMIYCVIGGFYIATSELLQDTYEVLWGNK